jgi:hypothetical protein
MYKHPPIKLVRGSFPGIKRPGRHVDNAYPSSKGKGKAHPTTGDQDPEGEQRYSTKLSLTSPLDGVGGQRHAPGVLAPEKTRYPL